MKFVRIVALAACASAVLVVHAQTAPASASSPAANPPANAPAPASDGEVRKIDKAQGKLTLRHGPLANLDMPAMTMVFRAADPKLLEGIQEGDKVKFTAEKVNGAYTVTAIQVAR